MAGSDSASEPKASKKQIAALFDGWNAALQTGDSGKVADLYAKDGVLLPTVSNNVRSDRAEIVDYFNHFLENKPVGKKIETIVNVLDSNTAIDSRRLRVHAHRPRDRQEASRRGPLHVRVREDRRQVADHEPPLLGDAGGLRPNGPHGPNGWPPAGGSPRTARRPERPGASRSRRRPSPTA